MFEGLDDINWEQFGESHIAVGVMTSEIPTIVRNMLHEDLDRRYYAISALLGGGQHTGMLGKATPSIIPFVLEVLAIPDYSDRFYIIRSLASSLEDQMFRTTSFQQLRLAIQTYDAIKQGYPIYKHLLADPDTEVRQFAVEVMAYMQDNSLDALLSLQARLAVESNDEVRRKLIWATIKVAHDSIFPYYDETHERYSETMNQIKFLYSYLKGAEAFNEQVQFAHALKEHHFYVDKEVNEFRDRVLASADSVEE